MPSESAAHACALALVADRDVGEASFGDHLSSREAVHLGGLANPRVRRRWLAGRLAAKNLVLRGPGRPPRLIALDGERLRVFPAASYREIELLTPAASGPPRLTRRGREIEPRVSISHGGGLSCAAVTSGGTGSAGVRTGVDLETVAPHVAAFYRGNFTPRERRWAEDGAGAANLPGEWLYTFLWTVKEAALKSGATAARSVWELASLEVLLSGELRELLASCRRAALGERFVSFETVVLAAQRKTRARIETTATPEAVLSLFTPIEASR